jgi:methyl-accepting chemotaxis protein
MTGKKRIQLPTSVKRYVLINAFILVLFFLIVGTGLVFLLFYLKIDTVTIELVLLGYLVIAVSFYFILYKSFITKGIHNIIIEDRTRILTSFYTINSQMDIIISLFLTLEKIRRSEDNPALNLKYEKLKGYIQKTKETIVGMSDYNEMIESPETLDEELLERKLKEINNNMYDLSENIVGTVEEFTYVYTGSKSDAKQSNFSIATLVYFLANIIPIISDLSSASNKFSRNIIMKVIAQFEEIANFSTMITEDIQNTMTDLMDEEKEDSLAFIIKKAHQILEDFEEFFRNMEKLKTVSNNFVDTSIEKLNGISDIAASIEEIAETIKVISLNVSIEAANTGSTGKGFQVLARDLREFAHKTRQFALDVKTRVRDTIDTTKNMKDDYIQNMNNVYRYVEDMKASIVSFETIIVSSFDKIKGIIDTLRTFSTKISDGIKEIVGRLQYYDITSQEVEHLGQFIEKIFKISSSRLHEFKIEEILDDTTRQDIKKDILKTIEQIITTKNEREIYEEYERIFGIQKQDITFESSVTTEFKKDDDIIIFLSGQLSRSEIILFFLIA